MKYLRNTITITRGVIAAGSEVHPEDVSLYESAGGVLVDDADEGVSEIVINAQKSRRKGLRFERIEQGIHRSLATPAIAPAVTVFKTDEFVGQVLDPVWGFDNPGIGDGSFNLNGTQLEIVVPSTGTGANHDAWQPSVKSPQMLQTNANTDFEVETRLASKPLQRYTLQGLIIRQDLNNFIRFDFYHDGSSANLFAAAIIGSVGSSKLNIAVTMADNERLKVKRVGDVFTVYRHDGIEWIQQAQFTQELTVNYVGLYAGNADGGSGSPPFTGTFHYFADSANPVE